jgi:hypothetical protein
MKMFSIFANFLTLASGRWNAWSSPNHHNPGIG